MIAKSVSEFTLQPFWDVMKDNVMAVFNIATLLKEQVKVEENRNGKISS